MTHLKTPSRRDANGDQFLLPTKCHVHVCSPVVYSGLRINPLLLIKHRWPAHVTPLKQCKSGTKENNFISFSRGETERNLLQWTYHKLYFQKIYWFSMFLLVLFAIFLIEVRFCLLEQSKKLTFWKQKVIKTSNYCESKI